MPPPSWGPWRCKALEAHVEGLQERLEDLFGAGALKALPESRRVRRRPDANGSATDVLRAGVALQHGVVPSRHMRKPVSCKSHNLL